LYLSLSLFSERKSVRAESAQIIIIALLCFGKKERKERETKRRIDPIDAQQARVQNTQKKAAKITRNFSSKHKNLPFIPLVAFVEFPPKKADLSKSKTEPPFSNIVCAAERPAKPPPMTITLDMIF